jgi:MFS family permease
MRRPDEVVVHTQGTQGPATSSQLLLAYAIGAFGLAINSMTIFLLPLRADELGGSVALIGLLVGTKAFVEAVCSIPIGRFIDRIGPRRAFVAGALGTSLTCAGFLAVDAPVALLPLQVVLGVTRTLGWVASQVYIGGSPRRRARPTPAASASAPTRARSSARCWWVRSRR